MARDAGPTPTVESPTLRWEQVDDVCVLTLARPEVHNALDLATIESLTTAVVRAGRTADLRAVILTGEGPSFCSGDDLRDVRTATRAEFVRVIAALQKLTQAVFDSPLPVVAALNGPAYGAGLELVLACDARVAVSTFSCAAPEVRLGLVATNATSLLLPQIVGPANARLLLMSGREFDVQWCVDAGLVDVVTEPADLMAVARVRAAELTGGHPNAVAATRWMLNAPIADALREALATEAGLCAEARESEEAVEAIRAFFEGRERPMSRDLSLAELVDEHARRDPTRIALRIEDDVLTYGDLADLSRRVATGLAALGVGPGVHVCTLMDTNADYVVVRLAISRLGGVEVALNTGFRGPSLVHGLILAGAALVVTDAPYLSLVDEAATQVPGLTHVVVRSGDGAIPLADLAGSPPLTGPAHRYAPGDPALVLFTSGSTGPSKGCLLPVRYVVRQAEHFCATLGITADDVLYAPFPLFHADGAVFTVAAAFSVGATAALSPRFSVSRFWDECRKHGVTVFDFMGATLTMLYKQPPGPRDRDHRVRLAWGVPAPEWAAGFAERFGVDVVEVYGLSDVGIVLYNRPGQPPPAGSCGRPIEAFEVSLHDADGRPVAGRRGGRDRGPTAGGAHDPQRVRRESGGDSGGLPRRLVPHG